MRTSRAVVAGVLAWVVVAGLGSAVTWAVISRAGDDLRPEQALPSSTPSDGRTQPPTPRPTRTSPLGTTSPTTAPPDPATQTPEPVDEPVRNTWQGLGGVVVVECRGAAVSLIGAQPESGFSIRVNDRGPQRVEVEFEATGERDAKSRVRSSCQGGAPEFEVDTDSD